MKHKQIIEINNQSRTERFDIVIFKSMKNCLIAKYPFRKRMKAIIVPKIN
jgi:calcineurin-like phosphoesterase family protein